MNSMRWYVDTDTFREFHYVDNIRLHAAPEHRQSQLSCDAGPPTHHGPGTEDSGRIRHLEHRHVTWWCGQSYEEVSLVRVSDVRL